jgi:hypothetical protein
MLGGVIIFTAILAIKNKLSMSLKHLLCVQMFVGIAALTSISALLITPFFISHFYWAQNGIAHTA